MRQPKRWATTSNLHWGSNEKQEKRKASGRKHFKPRPSSATSVSSVLDRSQNLASSSSVRRQLDMSTTSTTTTTTTTKETKRSSSAKASPSQRLAPFATDSQRKN